MGDGVVSAAAVSVAPRIRRARGPASAMLAMLALAGLTQGAAASAAECAQATVGYRVAHFGGKAVAIWYPTTAQTGAYRYSARFSGEVALDAAPSRWCGARVPIVVFSHGDLGCGLQSIALTEELARHGYIVAAPDHADAALCHIEGPRRGAPAPQPSFLHPETWTDATFADRRADAEAVLDGVLSDAALGNVADADRIGLAGHSLGGYTVIGLAGGWPAWRDARVRAVLALSPYVMPFQTQKTLDQIRIPLMYQGGTLDVGITPFISGPNGAFAQANAPSYLAVLRRAGHFAWVNCGHAVTTESCLETSPNMALAVRYAIAFFDHALRGTAEPSLTAANPELASYQWKP